MLLFVEERKHAMVTFRMGNQGGLSKRRRVSAKTRAQLSTKVNVTKSQRCNPRIYISQSAACDLRNVHSKLLIDGLDTGCTSQRTNAIITTFVLDTASKKGEFSS